MEYQIRLYLKKQTMVSLELRNLDGSTIDIEMQKMRDYWVAYIDCSHALTFCFRIDLNKRYPGNESQWYMLAEPYAEIRDGIIYPFVYKRMNLETDFISVLSLNMHTNQEKYRNKKISTLISVLKHLKCDFILMQECAQHKYKPLLNTNLSGIRDDNIAHQISEELNYRFYWDWAHYGWQVWEEGEAILIHPRWKFQSVHTRSISTTKEKQNIDSRILLHATCKRRDKKKLQLINTHVSWGPDQNKQLENIAKEAVRNQDKDTLGTLIGGDFNLDFNSETYEHFIDASCFQNSMFQLSEHVMPSFENGECIDYQFTTPGTQLRPVAAQHVFIHDEHADAFIRISDHYGVLVYYRMADDNLATNMSYV